MSKKLLVALPLLATACAFVAGTATAADGPKWKRVLVVGDDSGVNTEAKAQIADGFASSVERAVNLNLARVMYISATSNDLFAYMTSLLP